MTLENLSDDVVSKFGEIDEEETVTLDREARNELAMLATALEPEDVDELIRRGVNLLFQRSVETGTLDFHLRSAYDVTYDEYLYGALEDTYNQRETGPGTGDPDDRRYQF